MLKMFFDLSNKGYLTMLIKHGKSDRDTLEQRWEQIVQKNNDETGNFNYSVYKETLLIYKELKHRYIKVKACLMKLAIRCDYKVIDILAEEGYDINKEVNKYDHSLYLASRKSDNLNTKMETKRKELRELTKGVPLTFEKAIARASIGAKYPIPRDCTLSFYNETMKSINEQNKQTHGSRNRQA